MIEGQSGAVNAAHGQRILAELDKLARNHQALAEAQHGHEANAFSAKKINALLANLKKTRWHAGQADTLVLVQTGDEVRESGVGGVLVHQKNKNFLTQRRAVFRELCRRACRSAFGEQSKTIEWVPVPESMPAAFTLVWRASSTSARDPESRFLYFFWRGWSRGWGNEVITSVRQRADAHNFRVITDDPFPGSNAQLALDLWHRFVERIHNEVAAAPLASHSLLFNRPRWTDAAGVQKLQELGLKRIVMTGALFPLEGVSFVRQNDYLMGRTLAQMAIDDAARRNGKTVITLCMGEPVDPLSLSPGRLREKGFYDRIEESKDLKVQVADPISITIDKLDADYEKASLDVFGQTFPVLERDHKGKNAIVVTLSHALTISACKVVEQSPRSRIRVIGSDLTDSLFRMMLTNREILCGAVGVDYAEYAKAMLNEILLPDDEWLPNRFKIVDPYAITRVQARSNGLKSVHEVFAQEFRVKNPFSGRAT